MPIEITSNDALILLIGTIVEKVIARVQVDVLDILQTFIMTDVYEAAQNVEPREWYYKGTADPTYEFLNAFKFDDITKVANRIATELFYDWYTMSVGTTGTQGDYVHTQNGDFREEMASAFNVSGMVSGDWKSRQREPYWDNFINALYGSNKQMNSLFDKYMVAEFGLYGIAVTK